MCPVYSYAGETKPHYTIYFKAAERVTTSIYSRRANCMLMLVSQEYVVHTSGR